MLFPGLVMCTQACAGKQVVSEINPAVSKRMHQKIEG